MLWDEHYDHGDADDGYHAQGGGGSLDHLRRGRSLAIVAHRAQPVARGADLWSLSQALKDR